MAHLTRPAEISGVSAGLFPETAAGNRAYSHTNSMSRNFTGRSIFRLPFPQKNKGSSGWMKL